MMKVKIGYIHKSNAIKRIYIPTFVKEEVCNKCLINDVCTEACESVLNKLTEIQPY